MGKSYLWVAVFVILLVVGVFFYLNRDSKNVSENYCEDDSDCVPALCCHSNSCVNLENAPDCSGVYCTQVCQPGTLDCGQGSCGCVNNRCVANFD